MLIDSQQKEENDTIRNNNIQNGIVCNDTADCLCANDTIQHDIIQNDVMQNGIIQNDILGFIKYDRHIDTQYNADKCMQYRKVISALSPSLKLK